MPDLDWESRANLFEGNNLVQLLNGKTLQNPSLLLWNFISLR